MKNSLLILFLVLSTALATTAQTIRLVDNTPNKPAGDHVYLSLQAAIDSAASGDIIHVKPSESSYGTIHINKSLKIFGIGFNPQKDIPKICIVEDVYFDAGSDSSRISGFNINEVLLGAETATYTISGILIDNNEIDQVTLGTSCCTTRRIDNVLIRNNILGTDNTCCYVINLTNGTYNSISNVVITNNIIKPYSSTSYGAISGSALLIKNNLFY